MTWVSLSVHSFREQNIFWCDLQIFEEEWEQGGPDELQSIIINKIKLQKFPRLTWLTQLHVICSLEPAAIVLRLLPFMAGFNRWGAIRLLAADKVRSGPLLTSWHIKNSISKPKLLSKIRTNAKNFRMRLLYSIRQQLNSYLVFARIWLLYFKDATDSSKSALANKSSKRKQTFQENQKFTLTPLPVLRIDWNAPGVT